MLEVQKFLRKGNTLKDLEDQYNIKSRQDGKKVILDYDHVFSPKHETIVQECRGLILEEHSWNIICFPFKRFFNYGEGFAAPIDWESARIFEKIDGSNLNYSSTNDKWSFSTRKMIHAEGKAEIGLTYGEIAFEALAHMGYDVKVFNKLLNKNYTYMFEMVSPYTQVYIYYPTPHLYLLGVRDNISLQELDPNPISKIIGIPCPEEYKLGTIKAIQFMVNSRKGTEYEGVVVRDKFFNRIKVKNADYVAGQGAVFSLACSDKNIVQLIMNGNEDDVIPHCTDHIKEKIALYRTKFSKALSNINNAFESIKHIDNQKDFAKEAKKTPYSHFLFQMKNGKILNLNTYLTKNIRVDSLVDLLEKEEI